MRGGGICWLSSWDTEETWFRVFRSVPFPPLSFLAQTAIGLAANRGEESRHRLRRCQNATLKRNFFASNTLKYKQMLHRMQCDTQNQKPQMAGNAWFHYNTLFSCILFFLGVHMPVAPKRTGTPNKKPDFYDTCDAGVLIGKLPCTSTLAQSVANIPGHRKGRPRVMYHMNCLFMCHAVVNNAAQIYSRILFTRVSRELP